MQWKKAQERSLFIAKPSRSYIYTKSKQLLQFLIQLRVFSAQQNRDVRLHGSKHLTVQNLPTHHSVCPMQFLHRLGAIHGRLAPHCTSRTRPTRSQGALKQPLSLLYVQAPSMGTCCSNRHRGTASSQPCGGVETETTLCLFCQLHKCLWQQKLRKPLATFLAIPHHSYLHT